LQQSSVNDSKSCHEDNEEEEEEDEDPEDLDHQPSIGGDGLKILQNLLVAKVDVIRDVVDILLDAVHHLLLLLHYGGQLGEDASKLNDGALNSVHCVGPARVVVVLVMVDGGKLLRATHVAQGISSMSSHVLLNTEN